ncbi:hypothetical protein E3392_00765 [Salmonella enterica subsp. enterica serovar Bareilly str. CFSAN000954]|nr:hypothetical protein E3392_00765 [Salmonella enterica subsp. enterica serovar Bareilly str. CFSAN000954]
MNRIFKVLWNAATGTFIVTSETAKSRGKKAAAESWRFPHSSVLAVLWSLQMRWPMQGTIPAAVLRYQAQREAGGLQLVLMPQPILTPTLMAQAPQWVIMPPQWGNGVPPLVHTASPPATLR